MDYLPHRSGTRPAKHEEALQKKVYLGYKVLGVMEHHLAERKFLVAGHGTIADIALYAYTHIADEATFDLSDYPAINAWLKRVQGEPGHESRQSLETRSTE